MNENFFKSNISLWERAKKLKEDHQKALFEVERGIKKAQELEWRLFGEIEEGIKEFFKGKTINGIEIKFIPPGRLDSHEARWIAAFSMRKDGKLEVVILENIDGDLKAKTISYDFETEEVRFEKEV